MVNNKITINKENLIKYYHIDNLSLSEIGLIYGCSCQTILNRMKEWNINRRSVSESLINREHDWGLKISKALLGHKLSNETKKKISKSNLGKIAWNKNLNKCNSNLIKYGNKGEKHWNWKNGKSSIKKLFRQTSEYKFWRKKVFEKDNYTCQFCNKRGTYLEVHHIISIKILFELKTIDIELYNDLIFNIYNGYTLCKTCHKELHKCQIKKK